MEVKFQKGWARLFVSNDQVQRLKGFKIMRKLKFGTLKEEALFDRYHYNAKNLDVIDLESVEQLLKKLESQPLEIGLPQNQTPAQASVRRY